MFKQRRGLTSPGTRPRSPGVKNRGKIAGERTRSARRERDAAVERRPERQPEVLRERAQPQHDIGHDVLRRRRRGALRLHHPQRQLCERCGNARAEKLVSSDEELAQLEL